MKLKIREIELLLIALNQVDEYTEEHNDLYTKLEEEGNK